MCSHSQGLFKGRTSLKTEFLTPKSQMILAEGGCVCDREIFALVKEKPTQLHVGAGPMLNNENLGHSEP